MSAHCYCGWYEGSGKEHNCWLKGDQLKPEEQQALNSLDMTPVLGTMEEQLRVAQRAALRFFRERNDYRARHETSLEVIRAREQHVESLRTAKPTYEHKVGEAIMRACSVLPPGWTIEISLEQDAGETTLLLDGEEQTFASNNESLAETINDAIEHAVQRSTTGRGAHD